LAWLLQWEKERYSQAKAMPTLRGRVFIPVCKQVFFRTSLHGIHGEKSFINGD